MARQHGDANQSSVCVGLHHNASSFAPDALFNERSRMQGQNRTESLGDPPTLGQHTAANTMETDGGASLRGWTQSSPMPLRALEDVSNVSPDGFTRNPFAATPSPKATTPGDFAFA